MRLEDLIIVSVDDHIVEQPDIFDQHLPKKYRDKAPKCVQLESGAFNWLYEDKHTVNFALNAVAGRPKEELGFEPNSFEHIRKGCYDVHGRIDDMNVNGILASVNFPTFPGFALNLFQTSSDKKRALALVKAYNDWHIDEWCAAYPGRYIPMVGLPLWDVQEAVKELKRTVAKGARTITFPALTADCGLPSIHHPSWKPLWDALADEGIPISIHITGGAGSENMYPDSPIDAMMNKVALCSMAVAAEWLWSTMPREYDNLKIVLSEGGIGWLPYFLERADLVQKNHGPWTRQKWGGKRPSDVFREHFISCFIEDRAGVKARHDIGIDIITFENDYPHADITWPNTPEQLLHGEFAGVPDEDIDKITHLNALRTYNWDPFSVLGREKCTVGALREQGRNVDMTPISGGGVPPTRDPTRIVTAADVAAQFPAPVTSEKSRRAG
jgi:predicted TIM-barrel fold metal-dependent hydrolase